MTAVRKFLSALSLCIAAFALAAFLSGCATTSSEESELPWNAPQPWEGSPMIPGFSNAGR